jgi:hypothetical protein
MIDTDALFEDIDKLSDGELYALSTQLLATVSGLTTGSEAETQLLMHIIVIQDMLLKRHGYGQPRRQRQRKLKPKGQPVRVFRRKPPKPSRKPGDQSTSLTHNPFTTLGSDGVRRQKP